MFFCVLTLSSDFFCAVVILVPTRELALQTSQVCKQLGKHLKIQVMVTTGGTSLKDDIMRLYQPVHLLVGTPGRIIDLAKKGVCILKDCSMLVMDEVDASYLNSISSFDGWSTSLMINQFNFVFTFYIIREERHLQEMRNLNFCSENKVNILDFFLLKELQVLWIYLFLMKDKSLVHGVCTHGGWLVDPISF